MREGERETAERKSRIRSKRKREREKEKKKNMAEQGRGKLFDFPSSCTTLMLHCVQKDETPPLLHPLIHTRPLRAMNEEARTESCTRPCLPDSPFPPCPRLCPGLVPGLTVIQSRPVPIIIIHDPKAWERRRGGRKGKEEENEKGERGEKKMRDCILSLWVR